MSYNSEFEINLRNRVFGKQVDIGLLHVYTTSLEVMVIYAKNRKKEIPEK